MELQIFWQYSKLVVAAFLPLKSTHDVYTPVPGDAALRQLNILLSSQYTAARHQALKNVGPVIIASNYADFTLAWPDGRQEHGQSMDPLATNLKCVAHIPLALAVVTQDVRMYDETIAKFDLGDQVSDQETIRLGDSAREAMKVYRDALAEASQRLDKLNFSLSQVHRQHRIANASDAALSELLSDTGMPRGKFIAFIKAMTPLVMANVEDAAKVMLNGINRQMHAWRAKMLPEEWRNLRVVVTTSHMPREGFLTSQYFERLLHESPSAPGGCGRERRLFSMTVARPGTASALDFLGTHLVDAKAGVDFFGDAGILHRDILADAAEKYLKDLQLPAWP